MDYWTYAEIKSKIEKDLDIEDEIFIQSSELMGYVQSGIDEAEAEINSIYEDYFLSKANISLVNGTDEYTLPADLYANKIRCIMFRNGAVLYEVKRAKGKKAFLMREYANQFNTTDNYVYFIINSSGLVNPKLLLVPAARETLSNGLVIFYIRNANTMVDDTTICDIPEFVEFVIQYAKVKIMSKEGNPGLEMGVLELERQRRLMVDTLSNMIPDEDTLVETDTSFYEEMS